MERTKGVGVLPADELIDLGVTGPALRAAGVDLDLRKKTPYSGYEHFDFEVPVGTNGDAYDRYLVRMREMRESVRIIEQALDGMPEGSHIIDDRKIVLPAAGELATSMEALIHHFKLVTEGFGVPAGEAYSAVESPRGELGCYVVSDGGPKPQRVHMRDPSFVNLQALRPMARNAYLADMIAMIGSLDNVMGGRRPMTADQIREHLEPIRHEFAEERSLILPALKFAQGEKGWLDRGRPGGRRRGDRPHPRLRRERRELLRPDLHRSDRQAGRVDLRDPVLHAPRQRRADGRPVRSRGDRRGRSRRHVGRRRDHDPGGPVPRAPATGRPACRSTPKHRSGRSPSRRPRPSSTSLRAQPAPSPIRR